MTEHATPPPRVDDELLSAYLDDEVSPVERALVEAAVSDDPAVRDALEQLRAARELSRSGLERPAPDPSESISIALAARPATQVAEVRSITSARSWRDRLADPRMLGAAAAIVAILALPIVVFSAGSDSDDNLATGAREDLDQPVPSALAERGDGAFDAESFGGGTAGAATVDYLGEFSDEGALAESLRGALGPGASAPAASPDREGDDAANDPEDVATGDATGEAARPAAGGSSGTQGADAVPCSGQVEPVDPERPDFIFSSTLTYQGREASVFVFEQSAGDGRRAVVVAADDCSMLTAVDLS